MTPELGYVVSAVEVEPQRAEGDTAETRVAVDGPSGSSHLEQRVVTFSPGRSLPQPLDGLQGIMYVVSGSGSLEVDGRTYPLEPGTGKLHIGGQSHPIGPGTCMHLPPRVVHALENDSGAPMSVLGVFHPSGVPASRAYESNE